LEKDKFLEMIPDQNLSV